MAGQLPPELDAHSPHELGIPSQELFAGEAVAEIEGHRTKYDTAGQRPSILERIAQTVRKGSE